MTRPVRRSGSLFPFLLLEVLPGRNLHPLLFFVGGFRPLLHRFFLQQTHLYSQSALSRLHVSGEDLAVGCGWVWLPSCTTSLVFGDLIFFIFSTILPLKKYSKESRYQMVFSISYRSAFSCLSASWMPSLIGRCMFFLVLAKLSIFSRATSTFFKISSSLSFISWSQSRYYLTWNFSLSNGSGAFSVTSSSPPNISSHKLSFKFKLHIYPTSS